MNWLKHKARSLNAAQVKHLAETARLIATAQFAVFGYTSLQEHRWLITLLSAVIFAEMEWLAVKLLENSDDVD